MSIHEKLRSLKEDNKLQMNILMVETIWAFSSYLSFCSLSMSVGYLPISAYKYTHFTTIRKNWRKHSIKHFKLNINNQTLGPTSVATFLIIDIFYPPLQKFSSCLSCRLLEFFKRKYTLNHLKNTFRISSTVLNLY